MIKTSYSAFIETPDNDFEFSGNEGGQAVTDLSARRDISVLGDGSFTFIPYHAVRRGTYSYNAQTAPDPVDANCVEGGEDCKTIFDGTVTLEDDGGALTGELTLDSEMVVGSTVTTVINGHSFTGTVEEQGGGLMVGVWLDDPEFSLVTRLGDTSITVPSDVAEVGENTLKIVQCEPECETLYEGDVTFTYDEDEGAMAGTFNMTGAFTEGETVNVTLAESTASGTIEDHDGMLGALLSVEGNVVGAIFTADGVTTIDMQGSPGEPVTIPVKVEQCSSGGSGCDIETIGLATVPSGTTDTTAVYVGGGVQKDLSVTVADPSVASVTFNRFENGAMIYDIAALGPDGSSTVAEFCDGDCCASLRIDVQKLV